MQYTVSQQKALDLSNGKVVLAGAGSGKTTVLTARYFKLLEMKLARPREIAVVTFTRKAAAQLFSRIDRELINRSKTSTEDVEFWLKCREEMINARIGTIHGFCTSLLRAFPFESMVDPEFTIDNAIDPILKELIHRHIGALAFKRDRDLDLLLDSVGGRNKVEWFIHEILSDNALKNALQSAIEKPVEAIRYLNETASALIAQTSGNDNIKAGNHAGYVARLNALTRIALPLIDKMPEHSQRLSYDDLEQYTLKLLKNHPGVAKQVRKSLKFILVDEFQDNSELQWEIIRQLALDDSDRLEQDKLFLVGDEKQSIYGFRGANVTVVWKALSEMTGGKSHIQAKETNMFVNLNDNFRTLSDLINPLNDTFEKLFSAQSGKRYQFEAEPQQLIPKRYNTEKVLSSCEVALGIGQSHENMANFLAKRIRDELGTPISDPDGHVRALVESDIAILLRSRTRLRIIEKALSEAGIPYQSIKNSGYFDNQEVRDLIHLFTALADPRDSIAKAGVLRSPIFNISDAAITLLVLEGKQPFDRWEELAAGNISREWNKSSLTDEDITALDFGFRLWKKLEMLARKKTPAELLLYALEESGGLSAYSIGLEGDRRLANIYHFIELVREIDQNRQYSLKKLVARLKEMTESEEPDIEPDTDIAMGKGVRILTIHAAKGLEFPFVILADLSTKPSYRDNKGRGNLLTPAGIYKPLTSPALHSLGIGNEDDEGLLLHEIMEQLTAKAENVAESKRLMYVAATRARDRLLLISRVALKKNKSKSEMPNIPAGSQLEYWFEALGIDIDEDGSIKEPAVNGVNLTFVTDEMCQLPLSAGKKEILDLDINAELPKIPSTAIDPGIRISKPSKPERLVLPMTAFASYLAHPDEDSLNELAYRTGSNDNEKWLPLTSQENIESKTVLFQQDQVDKAKIGSLVHNLYHIYGPGCKWSDVEKTVMEGIKRDFQSTEEIETITNRIKIILLSGEKMGLSRLKSNSKREVPLLLQFSNVLLRGRADLITRDNDSYAIIDYKTNDIPKDQIKEEVIRNGYDHQARIYSLALMKARKIKEVRFRFAFLIPAVFHEITLGIDDKTFYKIEIESVRQRLLSLIEV
ncbi:MAG: UvrD-helicase domain-containing protein [Candidatus Electryonea clarkiae]|nr:UvrD-helicase domain-containing protein [Candidatus Electryonea clarkiae]MDP8286944.1 UvrD-helicase domain-containing protein [Candidatus Electryonea clarkiae]